MPDIFTVLCSTIVNYTLLVSILILTRRNLYCTFPGRVYTIIHFYWVNLQKANNMCSRVTYITIYIAWVYTLYIVHNAQVSNATLKHIPPSVMVLYRV